MELRDPNRPSIDPRKLLLESGRHALAEVLATTGYIPQAQTVTDVALALRQYHPILFGGPRGSGKTSLGEGLAKSCNLTLFYLAGVEGLTVTEVLGGWRYKEQEQAVLNLLESGLDLSEARSQVWTSEDRKSTRLNSSHSQISYAVFCLKKK